MTVSAPPRTLRVSEIFGPTFQGEGSSLGRRCSFVRLGACNLQCTWCDTPYTWDWTGRNGTVYDPRQELTALSVAEVWADVQGRGADMLVVSGGEPLLQDEALLPLLRLAKAAGQRIEIETAGTIAPATETFALVDQFNVSVKLEHSGNARAERYKPTVIDALAQSGKASWKFVARVPDDLDEVGEIVAAHSLTPVWIMPEGRDVATINERAAALSDAVLARGWNLTTRLHVQLFGDRRGI